MGGTSSGGVLELLRYSLPGFSSANSQIQNDVWNKGTKDRACKASDGNGDSVESGKGLVSISSVP